MKRKKRKKRASPFYGSKEEKVLHRRNTRKDQCSVREIAPGNLVNFEKENEATDKGWRLCHACMIE